MVEPMAEWLLATVMPSLLMSEVGKAEPARWMILLEDRILLGAMYGTASSNAPLRQRRYDLAVSYSSQRIRARRPRGAFFWMAARIGFNAIGSCNAEPGLCRSGGRYPD